MRSKSETQEALTWAITNDGLPVAYAHLVSGTQPDGEPFGYMRVDCCPLCGESHTHTAHALYGLADGRLLGYVPHYGTQRALCASDRRARWLRRHPEVARLVMALPDEMYFLAPQLEPSNGGSAT